ncbi:MAG TPA: hypothetical protein VGJ75_15025 [Dongiaceae bacterium]|jgi:hypothetical protein
MTPTIRTFLTSFMIAAVAPVGMAVLDLETPAFAKNNGGNGGGNGNGHGGDHGNSSHGNSGNHGNTKSADTTADSDTDSVADADDTTDDGLAPNKLGKLNGVLHASPNAIAHASVNSPIGTARAFGAALGGFLGQTTTDDTTTGEDATADDQTDPVTVDDLGAMMAKMTNKPVTADQVEAVANKLGIETEEDTTGDDTTGDDTTQDAAADDQTGDEGAAPKLDGATAQAIADKANEIHGFTDDTADDGDTAGDQDDDTASDGDTADDQDGDTADAGDDADTSDTDETVTN